MSSLDESPGVHIESAGDRYIPLERVETGVTAFLGATAQGPRNEPTRLGSFEQYEKVFGAGDDFMSHAVRGFFDNGGRTAYILNVAPAGGLDPAPDDFIGRQGTEVRGLQALERIEHVDLLGAPDLMFQYGRSVAFQDPGQVLAVQRAMIEHCEKLHDRFCLLDALPGHDLEQAIDWRRQFDSSHASFYFPWIKVRKGEEVLAPLPPSGHIAGMISRNDKVEGVHRAPANQPLEGLVDVAQRVRKRDRAHPFDHRVHNLVPFTGRGIRIWGARTLSSDPAFVQINVRRLFILVRKSVEKYAQWVVFEPNEPSLEEDGPLGGRVPRRSLEGGRAGRRRPGRGVLRQVRRGDQPARGPRRGGVDLRDRDLPSEAGGVHRHPHPSDRKSTRLNSSH